MKKLLLCLLLLTGFAFAQEYGERVGEGYTWSDSIYYGAGTATVDSVKIYDMRINYAWFSIIFEGNANTTVDSVVVRKGAVRKNNQGVVQDTVWGNQISWKDSSWSTVNTLINNTVGTHYTAFEPVVHLLKMEFLNTWAGDSDRKLKYILQAITKK